MAYAMHSWFYLLFMGYIRFSPCFYVHDIGFTSKQISGWPVAWSSLIGCSCWAALAIIGIEKLFAMAIFLAFLVG